MRLLLLLVLLSPLSSSLDCDLALACLEIARLQLHRREEAHHSTCADHLCPHCCLATAAADIKQDLAVAIPFALERLVLGCSLTLAVAPTTGPLAKGRNRFTHDLTHRLNLLEF